MAALDLRTWLAVACVALASLLGLQTYRVATGKTALAVEQRDRKDERLRQAERALVATEQNRQIGERRIAAQKEALDATQAQLDAARAAADLVPDLDRRVRAATAAVGACRRAAAGDPAAPAGGPAAEEATGVLAELQRRSQEAEGSRARYADEAATAGERCERIHDTLTVSPGPAIVGAE